MRGRKLTLAEYVKLHAHYTRKYGIDLAHYPGASARTRLFLKLEAFEAYGGCRCAWCGERDPVVLTIDHINQDGATLRRAGQPHGGTALYYWLKERGWPPGYRVLCYNHNVMAHWLAKRGWFFDDEV